MVVVVSLAVAVARVVAVAAVNDIDLTLPQNFSPSVYATNTDRIYHKV